MSDEDTLDIHETEKMVTIAFPKAPLPEVDNLLVNPYLGDLTFIDDFGGRAWDTIPHDVVHKQFAILPILTTDAFKYYLPSFIVGALKLTSPYPVLDHLIYSLAPPLRTAEIWERDIFDERVDSLTVEQKEVLFLVINYADKILKFFPHDPEYELETKIFHYWRNFSSQ